MKIIFALAALLVAYLLIHRWVLLPLRRKRRIRDRYATCHGIKVPALPDEFNRTFHVKSRIKQYKHYKVNIQKTTCNCRGFKRSRQYYDPGDIRRFCRHLRRELNESGAIDRFDPCLRSVLADRVRDRCYQRLTVQGQDIAVGYHPKKDFVRIFTATRKAGDPPEGPFTGPHDKFVLNTSQDSWIYGVAPPMEQEIITAVNHFLLRVTESQTVKSRFYKKHVWSRKTAVEDDDS